MVAETVAVRRSSRGAWYPPPVDRKNDQSNSLFGFHQSNAECDWQTLFKVRLLDLPQKGNSGKLKLPVSDWRLLDQGEISNQQSSGAISCSRVARHYPLVNPLAAWVFNPPQAPASIELRRGFLFFGPCLSIFQQRRQ